MTPFSRYGHTVVVYKRKFYLWGGRNDHPRACNRLFCFDPGKYSIEINFLYSINLETRQWSLVSIVGHLIPSARDGHSACIIHNRMYIFGGFEDSVKIFFLLIFQFD